MNAEEMRAFLRAHRGKQSRLVYLQEQADKLQKGIAAEENPLIHTLHGQQYEIMPHCSIPSSPVEKLLFKTNESDTVKRWRKELEQLEQEIWETDRDIVMVENLLSALSMSERAIITAHEIDGEVWPAVEYKSDQLLGYHMTADGLRRKGRRAIEKLCYITR